MDVKYIKRLLGKVVPKKAANKVLEYAYIDRGVIQATNLDDFLTIDTGVADVTGFLNVPDFYKTLSLENNIMPKDAFPLISDWPAFPRGVTVDIDPATLAIKWSKYIPHCADNRQTRGVLCGVYFNPELNETVATSGRTLLAEKSAGKIDTAMIVDMRSFPLLSVLPEITDASVMDEKYLSVSGGGVAVITRLIGGPYPHYPKAIPSPSVCQKVPITKATHDALATAIGMLTPYAPGATKLGILQGGEIFVYNQVDRKTHLRVKMPEAIAPETFVHNTCGGGARREPILTQRTYIGFNLELLGLLLNELDGEVVLEYGKTDIQPLVIRNSVKTLLTMPLRVEAVIDEADESMDIPAKYLGLQDDIKQGRKAAIKKVTYSFETVLRAFSACGMDTSTPEAADALREALNANMQR